MGTDRKTVGREIVLPKRSFSMEFWVGLFTLGGVACAGYLSVGLAGMELNSSDKYEVFAEFDNVSGLKYGASVEIAGVPIGEVAAINLNDPVAQVRMHIDRAVRLRDDDILSIRTKGIIGDRYIKVSRGGGGKEVPFGGTILDTESVIDIEDVIGKVVHSLEGKSDTPVVDDEAQVEASSTGTSVAETPKAGTPKAGTPKAGTPKAGTGAE